MGSRDMYVGRWVCKDVVGLVELSRKQLIEVECTYSILGRCVIISTTPT